MKLVLTISLLAVLCAPAVAGDVISLSISDTPIKSALDFIAQESGTPILLDGEITGKISLDMSSVPMEDAVKTVARYAGLNYRRLELLTTPGTTVTVEKLKSAIAALDALELAGLSVADPKTGKVSLVAKSLGADAKSGLKLPEGQRWQTYFLITKPEVKKAEDKAKDSANEQSKKEAAERLSKIVKMDSTQRQAYFQNELALEMQLPLETMIQLRKDRQAVFGSFTVVHDPVDGDQLINTETQFMFVDK